jgi:hypothetical protein
MSDLAALLDDLHAKIATYTSRGLRVPSRLLALLEDAEAEAEVYVAERETRPLAYARLWAPECRTCPHPDPRAPAPPKGRRGLPMVAIPGSGMGHRCPGCGVVEQRTSQVSIVQEIMLGDSAATGLARLKPAPRWPSRGRRAPTTPIRLLGRG